MSLLPFNSLVCWQITLTLLHVTWIGLVIGLIAALANRLLRNIATHWRYGLNFASLLLFAASLPVTFVIVRSMTAEVPAASGNAENLIAERANMTPPIIEEPTFSRPPKDDEAFAPVPPQGLSTDVEIPAAVPSPTVIQSPSAAWERLLSGCQKAAPFVVILYAIGVALMFVKLVFGVRVSRRLRSGSLPISDAHILARMAEQAKKLSLRIAPVIACCEQIAVPVVVGVLRPMILIPAAMVNGLTIEQLEFVLTHELAHLRRRDHWMIVVQRVLEAILFFHPVTWYLSHRIHDDRETSCDDLVLSMGCDRLQYAQSLLRVAELRLAGQSHQNHIALAADGQRPSKLRQRIARLLESPERADVRISSSWVIASVIGFAIVFTLIANGATTQQNARSVDDNTEANINKPLQLDDETHRDLIAEKNEVTSMEGQINRIGHAVLQKLEKETGDFLNKSQRQQLISGMKMRLAERVSVPLAQTEFESVLSAIGNSSRGALGFKFVRKDVFMTYFALLEWRIWVGMDPLKLTPEETARRERQREWFRDYIKAQPAPYEERTFREYDLLQYEELLSDPTYPFLFFPFSDDEFEIVKQTIGSPPVHGFASKRIHDQYDKAHRSKVEQRWHYSDDKGSAIWGHGTEYLTGFADDTIAEAELPDAGPGDIEHETRKQDQTPEKKVYTAPPKDAIVKLLGANIDLNAARQNPAGLQYTSIEPAPEQEWEPVALEEAFEVVLTGMKENFSRIKTWSGECHEVIVRREKLPLEDVAMVEESHLVRFAWDVPISKGGAVQTASKEWRWPVSEFDTQDQNVFDRLAESEQAPDEAKQFHAEAIFYAPFFFGRQNNLHWDLTARHLKHFEDTETPESERFVVAYRAKDRSSAMWRIDTVYRGIQDKLFGSQIISGSHGFNVLRETRVFVLPDGKTFFYDEVLQSYLQTDGVFVPSERLERTFGPRTEDLQRLHLQRITKSAVNQPLEPLPVLTPPPANPPRVFPVDGESFPQTYFEDREHPASWNTETSSDDQAREMIAQEDSKTDVRALLNSDQPIQIIGQVRDIEGKPVSGEKTNHVAIPEQQLAKPTTEFIVTDGDGLPISHGEAKVTGKTDGGKYFESRAQIKDGKAALVLESDRVLEVTVKLSAPEHMSFLQKFACKRIETPLLVEPQYNFKLNSGIRIGGTVLDESGKPIEGVEVNFNFPADRPIEEGFNYIEKPVTTNAVGKWELAGVPANLSKLSFTIRHKSHLSSPRIERVLPEHHDGLRALADVRSLKAAPTFACTVIDPEGKPISGAMFVWMGGGIHTTNEEGFVQVPKVPVGPLEFTILSLDWAPLTMKVSIPQTAPVTVIMQKGKRVEFRAVDLQGKPIEGMRFYPEWPRMAVPSPDQRRMLPINFDVLRDILNLRTNADGLFVWENAPDMKLGYRIWSKQYLSHPGGDYGPEGSPHTLVFRPIIPVSMTILDAATGKPIADARITEGTLFKSNPAGSWYWGFNTKKSNSEGQLETSLRVLDSIIQFRVQANGYRPVVSQEFDAASLPDSPIALQIRLDPDNGFSGTALQPDGRPAAGAMIYTKSQNKLNSSKDLHVANGVVDESKITSATTTDLNGNFQIQPNAEPFVCLIVHDSGYLKVMDVELLKQTEFNLLPWASVKGELWLRGVPAANILVQLLKSDNYLADDTSLPHIVCSQNIRTDASGKFTFPKCMAGEWERTIIYDDEIITSKIPEEKKYVHYDTVRLIPGEERHEVIGRDGADVVGRVMLPADPEIVMNECDIYVDNVDARRLNGDRPSSTNSAKLEADGSFRILNLEAATHKIEIFIRVLGERDSEARYTQKIVITPERFVGKSPSNPIDLGEIQVEPIE
jgi:beta-lactamase regulating signal transducer with metallopeptidase domain